ncbi:DUF998 domain-containing protein [Cryptosporangium phraense]|uniref:DUF998 domain-containing protein n=1 Tax=Cryptosporangium phraense TaxID=2593070 RepID=A0A545AWP7_9ACTN|nr:DUF998 domain-containing protein [Cryptosporangium phraense]TQS45752.1 DUF998 domain-containing protein [Cryptosporangium phraense]
MTVTAAVRRTDARLLTAGAVAGPLYLGVSLIEASVRDGFDPTRHAWSQLSNGPYGWVHITLFLVTGSLVTAAAVGLHTRAGLPLGLYGLGLIGSGIFRADPGRGFPAGTPEVVPMSWHGTLHFVCGGIGFVGLVAACFVVARRYRPVFSRVTGAMFGVAFVALAASGGAAWALLGFTAAVVLSFVWLTLVCLHFRGKAL